MGKSSLEPQIMHEIHSYIDHFIAPNIGQPIKISSSIMMASANAMSFMIHGHRKDYTDATFLLWMKQFKASFKATTKAAISKNIPFAAYFPGDLTGKNDCIYTDVHDLEPIYTRCNISHNYCNNNLQYLALCS